MSEPTYTFVSVSTAKPGRLDDLVDGHTALDDSFPPFRGLLPRRWQAANEQPVLPGGPIPFLQHQEGVAADHARVVTQIGLGRIGKPQPVVRLRGPQVVSPDRLIA